MIYQLPNGKVIEITIDQFLRMTDEDLQYMIANNYGEEINNPFYDSTLHSSEFLDEDVDELDIEELNEDDLTSLSEDDEFDTDYDTE